MVQNKKQRIGILGGTFSPIHNGHLELAKRAYNDFKLDKVLIMPSGNSYMKSGVLSREKRVAMTECAIKDYPYFEISLIEVNRPGYTYTYETLEELQNIYPDAELFFILGADSLFQMETWKYPERIFEQASIICTIRDDYDIIDIKKKGKELEAKGARIEYLNMPKIDISSSDIRQKVKQHISISDLVPDSVLRYIEEEHLYED